MSWVMLNFRGVSTAILLFASQFYFSHRIFTLRIADQSNPGHNRVRPFRSDLIKCDGVGRGMREQANSGSDVPVQRWE